MLLNFIGPRGCTGYFVGATAGAVVTGCVFTKIFNAFWTVKSSPHAVGITTIAHAKAIRKGEDFFVELSMRSVMVYSFRCLL